MMSCKHATEMMSQAEDRNLGAWEKLSLKLHLLFCSGCRNYRKQLAFIRRAMRRFNDR